MDLEELECHQSPIGPLRMQLIYINAHGLFFSSFLLNIKHYTHCQYLNMRLTCVFYVRLDVNFFLFSKICRDTLNDTAIIVRLI